MITAPTDVLQFWFSDHARKRWFVRDAAFDDEIRTRFGAAIEAALAGGLESWETDAAGVLALVIVLDQFPRNVFRGSPRAFDGDSRARSVATAALAAGLHEQLPLDRRWFLFMPFEHSERLDDQTRSVALFTQWIEQQDEATRESVADHLDYAQRHHDIIARFGRFPHRNAVLGRPSTPEEVAFLREPGSSF